MTIKAERDSTDRIPVAGSTRPDLGPKFLAHPEDILCHCESVRARTVILAIRSNPGIDRAGVTANCRAGSTCESCHPDIESLIRLLGENRPGM